jgi:hypothetical protein
MFMTGSIRWVVFLVWTCRVSANTEIVNFAANSERDTLIAATASWCATHFWEMTALILRQANIV